MITNLSHPRPSAIEARYASTLLETIISSVLITWYRRVGYTWRMWSSLRWVEEGTGGPQPLLISSPTKIIKIKGCNYIYYIVIYKYITIIYVQGLRIEFGIEAIAWAAMQKPQNAEIVIPAMCNVFRILFTYLLYNVYNILAFQCYLGVCKTIEIRKNC